MPLKITPRNRLFIGILIIYTVGVLFFVYQLLQNIDPRYRESSEDSLVETAHLLATLAEQNTDKFGTVDTDQFQKLFNALYQREFHADIFGIQKDQIELRTYIVNRRGVVIFDSQNLHVGEDFSHWRDVHLVLKGEYAARTSLDLPNQKETAVIYVAAPIYSPAGQIIGGVTVGKPVGSFEQYIVKAQDKIISVGIFSAFAVAVLLLIIAIWLTQPLGLFTEYIRYLRSQKSLNLPRMGRRTLDIFAQGYENLRNTLAGKNYVSEYVQTLTHEIKSPLSAIRGAAELLQNEMPVEQRNKFLQNIEGETLRVQELVDHMLELTALEQIRFLQHPQPIALPPLLQELAQSTETIAAQKKIQVGLKLPASTEINPVVEGDALLLHRAIRNLIDNALDFSPENTTITITLTLEKRTACIVIQDRGPGIPSYAEKRIFERFYSLPRPSGKRKSSGLGLAFVKEITLLHHGTITLTNHVDPAGIILGAKAELKLPLID